jgi:hypothetical protein
MIWSATVRMYGMPIRGFDRLVDDEGAMREAFSGLIPIVTASGPDITRSAMGRVIAESVWLPSAIAGDEVSWIGQDLFHIDARLKLQEETGENRLESSAEIKHRKDGTLTSGKMPKSVFTLRFDLSTLALHCSRMKSVECMLGSTDELPSCDVARAPRPCPPLRGNQVAQA